MNAIGSAIRKLREDRGMSLRELSDKLNAAGHPLSHAALGYKERGGANITPRDRKAIAQALGMTLDEFDREWRASEIPRTDGDESGKSGIPVINRAPAGLVVDYEEYGVDSGQGVEYLDRGSVDDDLAFAVIVVGDSMEPNLLAGDYVVFSPLNVPKPKAALEPGRAVFVRFSPDSKRPGCCIARFESTDGKLLKFSKDNKKHKGLTVPREEIEQLAVAVERRSRRI